MGTKRRYYDGNGFLHLENIPISRVQVALYRGDQIDKKNKLELDPPLKADYLYGVFRSEDELFDKDVMKSFCGMPFRVGHQMLGKAPARGAKWKTVDSAPVDGVLMNVRRGTEDDVVKKGDPRDFLFGDIVIHTQKAIDAIARGIRQFSLGYRCAYMPVDTYPKPKYWKGEPYYFTQGNIVANHLALVRAGRAGESCALDEKPVGNIVPDDFGEDSSPCGVYDDDGFTMACDELPEGIELMNKDEEKAKEALVGLLNSEDEAKIQACVDFASLTEEQADAVRKMVEKMKSGEAQDASPEPVAAPTLPVEKKDQADNEPASAEPTAPVAPAEPVAPAATTEATPPAEGAAPEQTAQDAKCKGKKCATAKDEDVQSAPAETPAPTAPVAPVETTNTDEPPTAAADCKCKGKCRCKKTADAKDGDEAEESEKPKTPMVMVKTYTQDELDAAVEKARKEGRREGIRAQLLADATGEDATDKSEGDVARAACKKIKGLEFACDAADDEVPIAAIRGHLARRRQEDVEQTAKPKNVKTIATVAQDCAPRTHRAFNASKFAREFLGNK